MEQKPTTSTTRAITRATVIATGQIQIISLHITDSDLHLVDVMSLPRFVSRRFAFVSKTLSLQKRQLRV